MAKKETQESGIDLQEIYTRSESFLEQNRKKIMIGVGAVAVVFAGFFAFQYLYLEPKEKEAANAMWRAQQYFEIDSLEWALNGHDQYDGFETIAQKYSGTKAGKLSHYYLGIIYRDKADYETALNHFKEADFNDDVVGVIAVGNVGDMYVQLNNYEEGATWLEKACREAASAPSKAYLAPVYGLKAAKVYLELQKDDKAISVLEKITDGYDTKTPEYGEAEKLLSMLKARKA